MFSLFIFKPSASERLQSVLPRLTRERDNGESSNTLFISFWTVSSQTDSGRLLFNLTLWGNVSISSLQQGALLVHSLMFFLVAFNLQCSGFSSFCGQIILFETLRYKPQIWTKCWTLFHKSTLTAQIIKKGSNFQNGLRQYLSVFLSFTSIAPN